MTELQEKAIAKIDAEIEKAKGSRAYEVIGDYLINLVTAHPEAAEKLMDEKKSLAGAYKEMESNARKKAHNGCAVLTDEEGFEIVCDYFGLDYQPCSGLSAVKTKPAASTAEAVAKPTPQLDINLDDLL